MTFKVTIGGFNRARGSARPTGVGHTSAGSALRSIGAAATSAAEQLADNADRIRMVKAQGEFNRQVDGALSKLDPTSPSYIQDVETAYADAREGASSSAELTRASNGSRLDTWLQGQSDAGRLAAVAAQRQGLAEASLAEFDNLTLSTLGKIRSDPGGYEAYQGEMDAALQDLSPSIPDAAKDELEAAYKVQAVGALVEGLAEQGRHSEAQKVLEANSEALTGEQRRGIASIQRGIESRQRTDRKRAFARHFADVETSIIEAQSPSDLMAARAAIDALEQRGAFADSPAAKPVLLRSLTARQKSMVSADRTAENVMTKFSRGMGLDTQKEADIAWSQYAETLGETTPEERIAHMAAFTQHSTIAPGEVTNLLARAERAGDPGQLELSSMALDALGARAPSALVKNRDEAPMASLVSALVSTGIERGEAARMVMDQSKDPAAIKARKDQFDEEFADVDFRTQLSEELQTGIWPFTSGPEPDDIPAKQVDEYRKGVAAMYRLSGDKDVAMQAAATSLSRRSAKSDLAGGSVVDVPPETTFPNSFALPMETVQDVIRDDVEGVLESLNVPVLEGDFGGQKRWRLMPDQATLDDLAAGRPPTYRIDTIQFPMEGAAVYMPQYVVQDGEEVQARWQQFTAEDMEKHPAMKDFKEGRKIAVSRVRQSDPANREMDEDDFARLRGFK